MGLLHDAAGKVSDASLLLSIVRVLHLQPGHTDTAINYKTRLRASPDLSPLAIAYAAGPEEVPSVLQHGVNIDELSLPDGDEPTVGRVVILQSSSYQDGVCALKKENCKVKCNPI